MILLSSAAATTSQRSRILLSCLHSWNWAQQSVSSSWFLWIVIIWWWRCGLQHRVGWGEGERHSSSHHLVASFHTQHPQRCGTCNRFVIVIGIDCFMMLIPISLLYRRLHQHCSTNLSWLSLCSRCCFSFSLSSSSHCLIHSLVDTGGGAIELELARRLHSFAEKKVVETAVRFPVVNGSILIDLIWLLQAGLEQYAINAFGDSLEVCCCYEVSPIEHGVNGWSTRLGDSTIIGWECWTEHHLTTLRLSWKGKHQRRCGYWGECCCCCLDWNAFGNSSSVDWTIRTEELSVNNNILDHLGAKSSAFRLWCEHGHHHLASGHNHHGQASRRTFWTPQAGNNNSGMMPIRLDWIRESLLCEPSPHGVVTPPPLRINPPIDR